MKRYWKLVVLIPVIVIGIGAYYVNVSAKTQPQYYLATQKGHVDTHVKLRAFYGADRLLIGAKGSAYQSYWASLDANYYPAPLKSLAQKYPHFMIGKVNPYGFYVGNRVIGYASMDSRGGFGLYHIHISVYNKKQKTSSSFTVEVPQKNSGEFVYDVRISGQMMKLITRDSSSQSIQLYTLNIEKKRLVSKQTIMFARPSTSNHLTAIIGVNHMDSLELPSDYALFQDTPTNSNTSHTSDPNLNQLFAYDIRSQTLSKVKNSTINNLIKNPSYLQMSQVGNQLYCIARGKSRGQWRLIRYDLTDKRIGSDFTFSLKGGEFRAGVVNSIKIYNHRLYMMVTSAKSGTAEPFLAIVDLDTGKLIYQGVVRRKDNKALGNLQLYNISVR